MKKLFVIIIALILINSNISTQSVIQSNDKPVATTGSWWLYNTGNETLTKFKPFKTAKGNMINSSVIDTFNDFGTGNINTTFYHDKDYGFLVGFNYTATITTDRNVTGLFQFELIDVVSNIGLQILGKTIQNINKTIADYKGHGLTNSTYIFNANTTIDVGNSENYDLNGKIIAVYPFNMTIDSLQGEIFEQYVANDWNRTINENKLNRTVIDKYANGTVIVDNFMETRLAEMYWGYFAPSVFRVVETNRFVRAVPSLQSSLSLSFALPVKQLEDYNIVLEDTEDTTTSENETEITSSTSDTEITSLTTESLIDSMSDTSNSLLFNTSLALFGLVMLIIIKRRK